MHTAVHNARIQLLATLLNTMAGTFTVGICGPDRRRHLLRPSHPAMTDLQWFAFIILPIGVTVFGALLAVVAGAGPGAAARHRPAMKSRRLVKSTFPRVAGPEGVGADRPTVRMRRHP